MIYEEFAAFLERCVRAFYESRALRGAEKRTWDAGDYVIGVWFSEGAEDILHLFCSAVHNFEEYVGSASWTNYSSRLP